jgi:hypothetical protein
MLTYSCAKKLCMISKTEKANIIRKFYIDLEKLIITYKDSIVNDLNNQLGIKISNNTIIEKNKKKGLIYILKIDDKTNIDTFNSKEPIEAKIGNTQDLKDRMKKYNVGSVNELPIVFVYLTEDYIELEKCLKDCLKQYQIKNNQEKYFIELDFIKETIKYCTLRKAILLRQNKKLLRKKDMKYLIIIDNENLHNANELLKSSKKTTSKKATSKKATSKKATSKKATSKKATSKKATIKKATSKKQQVKNE